VVLLIGPVFLVAAAWFVWGPDLTPVPSADRVPPSPADIIPRPWRQMMTEPVIEVAGFRKKCMECHALFMSTPETPFRLNQHRNIIQAHGMNDRCFNCHDREDRNKLALPGRKTVAFGESPRLCATCHGTTYRDWQVGMHGRTTGSWDEASGRQSRLSCCQCHDPHAPAFPFMAALPGPNTLRMGKPAHAEPGVEQNPNPLRRWSRDQGEEEPH
jgi:hypothetical protein